MIPRNGQPAKKKNNTNSFVPILSFSHRLSCFNSVNYHLYTSSIDRITHNTARLKKYKPSALQRCGLPKETTKYVIITPKGNQKKREEEEQKQNPCQVLASKSKNLSLSLSSPSSLLFSLIHLPQSGHTFSFFLPTRQEAYLLSSLDASLRTGPQVLF